MFESSSEKSILQADKPDQYFCTFGGQAKYLYSITSRISDRFWRVAAHVTVEGAECGL